MKSSIVARIRLANLEIGHGRHCPMSRWTLVGIFLVLGVGFACAPSPKNPPIAEGRNTPKIAASVGTSEDQIQDLRDAGDASAREDGIPSDAAGANEGADGGGKAALGTPGNVRRVLGFAEVECSRGDFRPCDSDAEIKIPHHLWGKVHDLSFFRFDSPSGTSLACVRATIRQVHGHAVITAIDAAPDSRTCCE